jgi:hypothetical protein
MRLRGESDSGGANDHLSDDETVAKLGTRRCRAIDNLRLAATRDSAGQSWLKREGAEGELCGANHLRFGGSVGSLDAHACDHDGEVSCEVTRVDALGQVALCESAVETLSDLGFALFAPCDQGVSYWNSFVAGGESTLDRETAAWILRIAEHLDGSEDESLNDAASSGLVECVLDVGGWAFRIALHDFAEESFLVAEGAVEAGAIDAHGFGEVG